MVFDNFCYYLRGQHSWLKETNIIGNNFIVFISFQCPRLFYCALPYRCSDVTVCPPSSCTCNSHNEKRKFFCALHSALCGHFQFVQQVSNCQAVNCLSHHWVCFTPLFECAALYFCCCELSGGLSNSGAHVQIILWAPVITEVCQVTCVLVTSPCSLHRGTIFLQNWQNSVILWRSWPKWPRLCPWYHLMH